MWKKMAITLILLVPVALMAYDPGQELPPGATEVSTWYWDGSQWVYQGTGDPQALARAWTSGPEQGACNKENWTIDITVHASIAQWIEWLISGTRWDWRVRKPGIYAADCITACIKSNNDVMIDFEGFEDLLATGASVTPTIPIYYGFGDNLDEVEANGWVAAADLNADDDLIPDSDDLHAGICWKLWNKIEVVESNSSCEYEDQATITLTLMNIKIWIDPDTGEFIEPQP